MARQTCLIIRHYAGHWETSLVELDKIFLHTTKYLPRRFTRQIACNALPPQRQRLIRAVRVAF